MAISPHPASGGSARTGTSRGGRLPTAFESAYAHVAVGVVALDMDGRYLDANEAYCQIMGYRRAELLGRSFADLTPAEDVAGDTAMLRQMSDGAFDRISREKRYIRKDGSSVWGHLTLSVTRDGDALTPAYVVATLVNITERKHAETQMQQSRRMLQTVLDHIPQSVFWKDTELRYIGCNKAFAADTGLDDPLLVEGRTDDELFPLNAESYRRDDREVIARNRAKLNFEEKLVLANGETRWARTSKVPLHDSQGRIIGLMGITAGITEEKQSAAAMRESMEMFRATLEQSPLGISQVGLDGRYMHVNPMMLRMTGYAYEELLHLSYRDISHPDEVEAQAKLHGDTVAGRIPGYSMQKRYRRKDGGWLWANLDVTAVRDAAGKPRYFIASIEDVTARLEQEQRLQYLARYDTLTGLPNRHHLKERLEALCRPAGGDGVVLFMVNLDKFKDVNDSFGHEVGDQVLIGTAERIRAWLPENAVAAHLGADNFAVAAAGCPQWEVFQLADQLRGLFAAPFATSGMDVVLTASIGVSRHPDDDATVDGVIRKADIALFRAKEEGDNGVQWYTQEMGDRVEERLRLKNQLRVALEQGQFFLHYQPQVNLATGRIDGVEALLRWAHPERGLVSPATFIPLAEETGLIVPIGEWVLKAACAQTRIWQEMGLPRVHMAVNLSARQLKQPGFTANARRIIRDSGCDPDCVELEITEGILIENIMNSRTSLRELKAMGTRIALDDFGTGYSSLTYLKDLEFDCLKMDGSFVRDMAADTPAAAKARKIASGIITLAHHLELTVVAEGVETQKQLDYLAAMGCDHIQGYLFSKPLSADDMTELLRRKAAPSD